MYRFAVLLLLGLLFHPHLAAEPEYSVCNGTVYTVDLVPE